MSRYDKYSQNPRRLQGYDYRSEGLYFITICTKDRLPFFGYVKDGVVYLSDEGKIAYECWLRIVDHYPQVVLGEFIIMPNHVHGIIKLAEQNNRVRPPVASIPASPAGGQCIDVGKDATDGSHKNQLMANKSPKAGSISRIIGSYKLACTKLIYKTGTGDFAWQPRFYDRIIRDQMELERIETYIQSNPERWAEDEFYLL